MGSSTLNKMAALCCFEATKACMEQLGAHRLDLSQRGAPCPPEQLRVYGDLRRLRDYLQRCVADAPEVVELDLAEADAGLLVACCRRHVDVVEHRLRTERLAPDERQLLLAKQTALGDVALQFANGPLLELPVFGSYRQMGEAGRQLLARLSAKRQGAEVTQRLIQAPRTPPPSLGAGITSAVDTSWDRLIAESQAVDAEARSPRLVEPRRLRDPRLQSLVELDLQSFERAMQHRDHRLAAVLLAALVEAAVLDVVVRQRREAAPNGSPENWNFAELLLRVLGDRAQPQDRALAFQLFANRRLLRPAVQLGEPTVVTPAGLARLVEFAWRAMHDLGLTARPSADAGSPASTVTLAPGDVVLACPEGEAAAPIGPLCDSAAGLAPTSGMLPGEVVLPDPEAAPADLPAAPSTDLD